MNRAPILNRALETALFIVLTLSISWLIGWQWVRHPEQGFLTQWLMCTPGIVGVVLSYVIRREPPRAVGLAFTGAWPWIVALLYPFAMAAAAIALAYAIRVITGDSSFIYFQPEAVKTGGWLGLPLRPGLALVWVRMLRNLWMLAPWLLVAFIYRVGAVERLAALLPSPLRPLHHLLRLAMLLLVMLCYGSLTVPPGAIGEEVGWRGTLVRHFADRPLLAVAITAPLWAAFHLPVVFAVAQAGNLAQNVVFLGSIAAAATPFAALYLWSRSLWPCVVLHYTWNVWNPFLLGDVYGGGAGLFGGRCWIFNGEGLFGMLFSGALTVWLVRRWQSAAAA